MPIISTVIRINKSASNSSKYAAKSSLNFNHFIYFIFQKKRRVGAHKVYTVYTVYTVYRVKPLKVYIV